MSAELTAPCSLLYFESSALLAALLEAEASARSWLNHPLPAATSALTLAEATRGASRALYRGRIGAPEYSQLHRALLEFENHTRIVPISGHVLARAGARFPVEPVRTLDAIHLVTAQLLGEPAQHIRILTRDRRVRENALALGFQVA